MTLQSQLFGFAAFAFFIPAAAAIAAPATVHATRAAHARAASIVPKPARETALRAPSAFETEAQMSPRALMSRWDGTIAQSSKRFGIPASWIRSVMKIESGGRTMESENKPLVSRAGAMGLMQLMPETWREMRADYGLGADPFDPHDNITAGAAYLRALYKQYGYPGMFAAYNDGPGNLEQRMIDGRMLPAETELYVGLVTGTIANGGGLRSLARFTQPNGVAVMINGYAVQSVRAPFAGEYAPGVRAVIAIGKKEQGVRESVARAKALLRAHGARV